MRLVIARCSVDYAGRLSAHLPMATRLLIVKDGNAVDAATGEAVSPLPENRDDVVVNNRLPKRIRLPGARSWDSRLALACR